MQKASEAKNSQKSLFPFKIRFIYIIPNGLHKQIAFLRLFNMHKLKTLDTKLT